MSIELIQRNIATVREEIVQHALYNKLQSLDDVKLFMEHHIFAVWDFMSLLKGLQRTLTCVEVPWVPKGSPDTRYFINEIVTGEESDVDQDGKRCSHFELYLRAMEQAGADTSSINGLLADLSAGKSISEAIAGSNLPAAVKGFLSFTFDVIASGKAHVMAAVFTFGREDLIPDMFHELVKDLNEKFPGKLNIFNYYLERHIEVDGDHHSILSMQMVSELCGNDISLWEEASTFAVKSLEWRKSLWSAVLEESSKKYSK
ncbi:Protein of unknown function (DUF3050) [Chitinophaga skermanii]|uniref:DUF3050 family protein n=1 Tax=Chitinophaga skermanii TaxID=331697 RepID=A0A327Q4H9_9BACT|nr:DUF3050 domain-containing protein [Chitinophaga skermanii]RAI98641.1 Protein of unknown function (DUF3050) [Chitinophaga skermanii]